MKHILNILLAITIFSNYTYSQAYGPASPRDETTGKITYQEVVELAGVSVSNLYERAKESFAKDYILKHTKFTTDDKTAGKVAGTCIYSVYIGGESSEIKFDINVAFKAGRYRYVITNFTYKTGIAEDSRVAFEATDLANKRAIYDANDLKMKKMLRALISSMKQKSKAETAKASDDW